MAKEPADDKKNPGREPVPPKEREENIPKKGTTQRQDPGSVDRRPKR